MVTLGMLVTGDGAHTISWARPSTGYKRAKEQGISPPKAVYHRHKRNTTAVLVLVEVTANKFLLRETVGHVHDHATASAY